MNATVLLFTLLAATRAVTGRTSAVELPDGADYVIGTLAPTTVHIWVDPVAGVDAGRTGLVATLPLKTFKAAWNKIPTGDLAKPYHIHIKPGSFSGTQVPTWWEDKRGSYSNPIIVEATTPGTVTFKTFVNIFQVSYIYLVGINVQHNGGSGHHPFHCTECTGLLMRNVKVLGTVPRNVREVVKLNQCQGVYIEDCEFSGATDNAIDMVGAQYGHVLRSNLHHVGFGIYLKGGSAHFIVAANRVHHCTYYGIMAGFNTGFEWMVSPWIRYEAYDIKVYNNVVHDVEHAGLSAWGGYQILLAHNTLYRVGRAHSHIGVRLGIRSCDGEVEENCLAYYQAGGWGPWTDEPWTEARIPNRGVIVANNLVLNPSTYRTADQHFKVDPPMDSECPGCRDLDPIVTADDGLFIRGNLIKNGGSDMPLGVEWAPDDSGCYDSPTCNPALLRQQNAINTITPRLVNPGGGNFRPVSSSIASFSLLCALPSFDEWAPGPGTTVPAGNPSNLVLVDADGKPRTPANNAPGAYVRS